jgi:hypothetical protein
MKNIGHDGDGGDAQFLLHVDTMADDRRRTGASMADGYDHAVSVLLYFSP